MTTASAGAKSHEPKPTEFAPLTLTGYATLGLLSPGERFTAVEIQERANHQLRHFYWAPALSHIRRELNRLEDLGYVDSQILQQGRVKRTLTYSITDLGAQALSAWAEQGDVEPTVVKNAVLLRLWLGRRANDSHAVVSALQTHRERISAELASLDEEISNAEQRFKQRLLALEEFSSSDDDLRVYSNRAAWHLAVMRYSRRSYEAELENSQLLFDELSVIAERIADANSGS